ncbi:MAG: VanZ family protein [Bacilli bacterium]
MFSPINNTIHGVMQTTWPMLFISVVVAVSLRITYLFKSKTKIIWYKELLMLIFMVYILCLFQIVTAQDLNDFSGNNFIPFKEILRYNFGSRLFLKNVLGNILLFVPYGLFVGIYINLEKFLPAFMLISLASLSIETTQLVIGRVFDVDDILLNIVGGLIGFYIYRLLDKVGDILPSVFKSTIFLNIVVTLLLVFLVVYVFMI